MQDHRLRGTSPEQLAALLAVGDEGEGRHLSPEEARCVLEGMLAVPLPEPPGAMAPGGRKHQGQRTIADVLLDPAAGLGALKTIKAHAKNIVAQADSETERAAGTAIYYAAIAKALILHGQKITRFAFRDLAAGLKNLAGRAWVPKSIKTILSTACDRCERRF